MRKALTPDQEAEAVSRYKADESLAAIAADFGVHRSTIARALAKAEQPRRNRAAAAEARERTGRGTRGKSLR